MKKYTQTDQLQKMINWDEIMKMPRYAGGHDDQMKGLFKDVEIIAHWNENDYSGMVATCVRLSDNKIAIYNDYYGSCSGCDSWEGATDEGVKNMCIGLSNSAYVFDSIDDVKNFLSAPTDYGFSSWTSCADKLLSEITNTENQK